MIARRYHVFAATICLIGAINAALLLVDNTREAEFAGRLVIGLIWGSILGQVTLAASWVVLGPFRFWQRLLLSALWTMTVQVIFTVLIVRDLEAPASGSELTTIITLFGLCIWGQWILVQGPLWLLYVFTGAQLKHPEALTNSSGLRDRQFGIRQVMIFTLLVSVVLAILKSVLTAFAPDADEVPVQELAFLFAATSMVLLPLVLSSLLVQRRWIAITFAFFWIAFATAVVIFLAKSMGGNGMDVNLQIFGTINAVASLWVILVTSLLHWSGYRLTTPGKTTSIATG